MYEYVLRKDSRNKPVLVKRKDGNLLSITPILTVPIEALTPFALIHNQYMLLYYGRTEDPELEQLIEDQSYI